MNSTIKEAYQKIETAVQQISSNEEWKKFLSFQSKFWNYSFQNSILIYDQRPSSTFVAGYKTWINLDRHVKKGEKAIKIFAPCKYKVTKEDQDEAIFVVRGFKLVNVYDIEQTEGDDSFIPVLVSGLKDNTGHEETIYKSLIEILDIPVTESADIASKGLYNSLEKKIIIKSTVTPIQKIKTLIHEYAHHIHLTKYLENEPKNLKELIAESVAYVVCSYLRIDTSDYSFGYIASWCDDPKQLKLLGSKVTKIASDIISALQTSETGIFYVPESATY